MKPAIAPNLDFISKRKIAALVSIVLIIISIGSLAFKGLNFGIDFTGGTIVELKKNGGIDIAEVRSELSNNGITDFTVSHFGSSSEILINIKPTEATSAAVSEQIASILGSEYEKRRVEFVGPKVGEELTNDGGLAMIYALIGILIYVAFRFEYRFALGSVVALIHDVIITLGFFSITGLSFDLTVLAALLAIIGYSLNDTVVVFDRVRENFLTTRKSDSKEIINDAINKTLARTLITSLTTMLVLIALFIFGGEIIRGFAIALIIGVIIGTYSSIYVASNTLLMMNITKEDLLPSEKEQQEIDTRP